MIEVERLSYQYPRQTRAALYDLSWAVAPGAYVVVTGQSGSGKSTLARCLNGLIPHFYGGTFGGLVRVRGFDTRTASTSALSRLVGFVAQDPESQTVAERVDDEIAFGPENHGLSGQAIRRRVEETIALLGLEQFRARSIANLSGGERQRVVIAAAVAMQPSALILDEPTSQLDPWGAGEVLAALERLNAERGMSVVLAEHRLDRVLGSAGHLLILDASAPPNDLPVRAGLARLPDPPVLTRLARALGWDSIPRSIAEAIELKCRLGPDLSSPDPPLPIAGDLVTQGPVAVEIERLSFAYGSRPALESVSVVFRSGAVTALMGRNGSGKTTLLKQINGLLRPIEGSVRVLGQDIAGRATVNLARDIGYLPQHPGAMLFNESVAAEIAFTLRCRRTTDDVERLLTLLGLSELRARNPADLSGGERQRAALAATLAGRPAVLLLDEPTRGMDAQRKRELGELLRLLASDGIAVILATHDAELVAAYADRIVLLEAGAVVADGSPREVLPKSSPFTTAVNQVFGGDLLTVDDVLQALRQPCRGAVETPSGPGRPGYRR